MYNQKRVDQVKCDVCGLMVENETWTSMKENGWNSKDRGGDVFHFCPDCSEDNLVKPFQKSDSEIFGVIDTYEVDDEISGWYAPEGYIDFGYRLTGREYEVIAMNADTFPSRYVEIERQDDGEKFWITP